MSAASRISPPSVRRRAQQKPLPGHRTSRALLSKCSEAGMDGCRLLLMAMTSSRVWCAVGANGDDGEIGGLTIGWRGFVAGGFTCLLVPCRTGTGMAGRGGKGYSVEVGYGYSAASVSIDLSDICYSLPRSLAPRPSAPLLPFLLIPRLPSFLLIILLCPPPSRSHFSSFFLHPPKTTSYAPTVPFNAPSLSWRMTRNASAAFTCNKCPALRGFDGFGSGGTVEIGGAGSVVISIVIYYR